MIKKDRHLPGCCRRLRKTHVTSSRDLVGHAFGWRCTSYLDVCYVYMNKEVGMAGVLCRGIALE